MNKKNQPPALKRQLQYANAAADAKFNADRFRKSAGDRTKWSNEQVLRTWFGRARK